MMTTQEALAQLAGEFRTSVHPSTRRFPRPAGKALGEASMRIGRFGLLAFATQSQILIEVEHLAQRLVFSLNRAEGLFGESVRLQNVGGMSVLVYSQTDTTEVLNWLGAEEHMHLLACLALGADEFAHFYRNGAWLSVRPERATADFIRHLGLLLSSLPPESPEDFSEGVEQLPASLRPLAAFFQDWAVSDDALRARKLQRASNSAQRSMYEAVYPRLDEIQQYLDSIEGPLPEAAVRLGHLAEAAAEVHLTQV